MQVINLERVGFNLKNFDMAIVFKDFTKEVRAPLLRNVFQASEAPTLKHKAHKHTTLSCPGIQLCYRSCGMCRSMPLCPQILRPRQVPGYHQRLAQLGGSALAGLASQKQGFGLSGHTLSCYARPH